jgi:hypothetical protein
MDPELKTNFGKSKEIESIPINKRVEEFEEKLREDNMHLFRQFRLKDFIVKAKHQDTDIQELKR